MKTHHTQTNQNLGSVLLVSLLVCAILGIMMGSYLSMIQTQRSSVAREQAWQRALVVAEAGVEEALAHLNTSGVTTNNLAVNNWTSLGGGVYTKGNVLGDSSYTARIIVTNNVPPVIISTGNTPGPVSTAQLSRTVRVGTKPKSGQSVAGAMVVSTFVNFSGFNINTDSFDSTLTNLFPGGLYNSPNAMDHGDVWTTSSQTNDLSVGNGKIKGTIHTGIGGQPAVGSGGSVGDKDWVNDGKTGIQMNPVAHHKDDGNVTFPDQTLPDTGGKLWLPPVAGKYTINGVSYKYLLNGSNPWKLPVLDGGVYVNGKDVKLWITGDNNGTGIAFGSRDELRIPTGNSISVYVGAANASVGGNGIINDTGLAKSFRYFGLPSNTSLSFAANGAFVGQINAPQATFSLGGGGRNTYDFVGSSITKSAKMNGHFNFHYDESLKSQPADSGYAANSWDEL